MPKQFAAVLSMIATRVKNVRKNAGYGRHELRAVEKQLESLHHHTNLMSNRMELMRIAGDAYQSEHFIARRFAGNGPCECDNCARWEKAREGTEWTEPSTSEE